MIAETHQTTVKAEKNCVIDLSLIPISKQKVSVPAIRCVGSLPDDAEVVPRIMRLLASVIEFIFKVAK
jgi:hypothetical protein